MNSDVRKGALIGLGIGFVLGEVAGGVGMYLYSKRYFNSIKGMEMREMTEYYENKYGKCINAEDKTNDSEDKKESDEKEQTKEAKIQSDYEAISDIYRSKGEQKELTSYTNCYDSSKSSADIPVKKKGGRKKKKVDIEVVDQEVWDENPSGLDSVFLVYYEADGALINEDTEKVYENDMDSIIKVIESNETTDGILILQDNVMGILYHITVEQSAYSESGLDD